MLIAKLGSVSVGLVCSLWVRPVQVILDEHDKGDEPEPIGPVDLLVVVELVSEEGAVLVGEP